MPRIKQYADKYAMSDLASHIRGRAKDVGKTQQDIGDALGICQQSASRWLRNPAKMTVGDLRKVAKIIDIDPAVILNAVGLKGV